jgi:hypothetical protein
VHATCAASYARGDAVTAPDLWYGAAVGRTAIGGPEYAGDAYPAAYRGDLFHGDYVGSGAAGGWIARLRPGVGGARASSQPFATGWHGGVALRAGPDGDLVHVAMGDDPAAREGVVRRIVFSPGNAPPVARLSTATGKDAPETLSSTRATRSTRTATCSPTPGTSATAPRWSRRLGGAPLRRGRLVPRRLLVRDAGGLRDAAVGTFDAGNSPPALGSLTVPGRPAVARRSSCAARRTTRRTARSPSAGT